MSLLESFVTHTFQRATVSAIIVTTIVILNACSDNNEPVPTEEAGFFTLTVEPSFPTSDNDNWVLASTRSGEWIDFQRFESGETIVLKGAVSDISSFVLHFLRVPNYAGQVKYYISSIAEVPVNSTWVLKEPNVSADDPKVLTLNVTNLPDFSGPFNDALTVNLSEPSPGWSHISTGNTSTRTYPLQNSPVDVFVTIYEDGHPKYVTYKDIVPPTTIDIDASTDGILADHTFVLSAPPNKTLSVTIDAFEDNEASVGLTTQFLSTTGETSLTVGYKEGYPKYRTTVHYQSGKKHATHVTTGSAVPETHTFPSFDFTFENIAANDFKAGSSVPFDAAVLSYLGNPLGTVWTVVLPGSDSPTINFKAKDFPKEIRDAHPDLPPVEQVRFSGLSAFQLSEDSYADVIEAASENGQLLPTLETDNYTLFGQGAD